MRVLRQLRKRGIGLQSGLKVCCKLPSPSDTYVHACMHTYIDTYILLTYIHWGRGILRSMKRAIPEAELLRQPWILGALGELA